jgi:hypothetical protein
VLPIAGPWNQFRAPLIRGHDSKMQIEADGKLPLLRMFSDITVGLGRRAVEKNAQGPKLGDVALRICNCLIMQLLFSPFHSHDFYFWQFGIMS